jgi:hypothetical protein
MVVVYMTTWSSGQWMGGHASTHLYYIIRHCLLPLRCVTKLDLRQLINHSLLALYKGGRHYQENKI